MNQYSNRFDEIMGRPMQQIDALCESAAKLKDRDFINDDNEISMKGDFDRCDECGFEAYRPMSYRIASLIAQGHETITGHVPDIYEKPNNSTNN